MTHSHEGRPGLQHAGPHGDVLVLEVDHVESDGLRHGQHGGQQPDPHDLHRRHHGNARALHPRPGRHRPVPGLQGFTSFTRVSFFKRIFCVYILDVNVCIVPFALLNSCFTHVVGAAVTLSLT